MHGIFISDLHLLSHRSVGQQVWNQHKQAIESATAVVLGGDIFDFRWSRVGDLQATLSEARKWLEHANAMNPNAHWVYLLGNHDSLPAMQSLLEQMQSTYPSFRWSSEHYRIGRNIFLHGDILDAASHRHGLQGYRSKFHEEKARGRFGNAMYSVLIQSRLHGVIPAIRHSKSRTCKSILRYLQHTLSSELDAIDQIYFGHTHVPLSGYRVDRFCFHNAGSGIRHLRCQPATFHIDGA